MFVIIYNIILDFDKCYLIAILETYSFYKNMSSFVMLVGNLGTFLRIGTQ